MNTKLMCSVVYEVSHAFLADQLMVRFLGVGINILGVSY